MLPFAPPSAPRLGRVLVGLVVGTFSSCAGDDAGQRAHAETPAVRPKTTTTPGSPTTPDSEVEHVQPSTQHAQTLAVATPPKDARFVEPNVEVMESMPVQFAINLAAGRPGHEYTLDGIGAPTTGGIIEAKLRSTKVAAANGTVRVPLGKMLVGSYELRIRVRAAGTKDYVLAQTLRLTAK